MKIQSIPVSDSPNNDAFEAVVELYYQTCGYITSSGKWFWVWEEGKQQRGYQDIDVLAVRENEVAIISVTSNLDDKIRHGRDGKIKKEMLKKLLAYYDRVTQYLRVVPQYKWMVADAQRIRRIVACIQPSKKAEHEVIPELEQNGIEVVSGKVILRRLCSYVGQPNMKVQDQMLRAIQVLNDIGKIEI